MATPWCDAADVLAQSGCADFDGDPGELLPYREAASDVLFALSGRQFGTRTVTLRPWQGRGGWGVAADQGWSHRSLPSPACFSPDASSLSLGVGPIVSVTSVLVDGTALVAGVDFRVDEGTWLVRLPAAGSTSRRLWPTTQRLDVPSTEDGTFEVTVLVGSPVPQMGVLAAAELACELSRLGDDDCALSPRVSSVNRQGVALEFVGLSEALQADQTGLPQVDLFLKTYNPSKARARARVLFPVPAGVRRTDLDGPS